MRRHPHAIIGKAAVCRHLLRQPNINFPNLAAVAANPSFNTNFFAPFPGYTSIQQYLSDSTSNYYALQTFLSKRAGNVLFTVSYTWSKALADASGTSAATRARSTGERCQRTRVMIPNVPSEPIRRAGRS